MLKAYPLDFCRDLIAVARRREAPLAQISKDFGVSDTSLQRWLWLADIKDGHRPGSPSPRKRSFVSVKNVTDCWSRRPRSCGVQPRIWRRRHSPNDVPAGP